MPGAGRYRFVATRDAERTYAMVYAPVGRPFTVRMAAVAGREVRALVVQPAHRRRDCDRDLPVTKAERTFTPPDPGELLDWILVLDDAAKGYRMPGQGR